MSIRTWIEAREHGSRICAVRRADYLRRQCVRQCSDNHIDDALAGIRTCGDGGGKGRVQERAWLNDNFRQIQHALVVCHARVEQRLERVTNRGLRCIEGHVDVTCDLLRCSCEVETDALTLDVNAHTDRNVARSHTVVVHYIG